MRETVPDVPLDDFELDDLEVEIVDLDTLGKAEIYQTSSSSLPVTFSVERQTERQSTREKKLPTPAKEHLTHEDSKPQPASSQGHFSLKQRKWLQGMLIVAVLLFTITIVAPLLVQFPPLQKLLNSAQQTDASSPYVPTSAFYIASVQDGVTYAMGLDRRTLHALRTLDGRQIWQYRSPLDAYPLVLSNIIYLLPNNFYNTPPQIQALRKTDGQLLWRHNGLPRLSWPLLNDQQSSDPHTLLMRSDMSIYALRASDGMLLWQHILSYSSQPAQYALVQNKILVYEPAAELQSQNGSVAAFSTQDGSEIWHADNIFFDQPAAWPPTYSSNDPASTTIYLSTSDGGVKALRLNDGSLIWQWQSNSSFSRLIADMNTRNIIIFHDYGKNTPATYWSVPAYTTVSDGIVYVSRQLDGVYALNAADGKPLWLWPDQQGNIDDRRVGATDGTIYIPTTDNDLYAINARDGKLLWHNFVNMPTYMVPEPVTYTIPMANGIAYITNTSNNRANYVLSAIRERDGTVLWRQLISTYGGIQLINGVLYAELGPHRPAAIRASDGYVLWATPPSEDGLQINDAIAYTTSSTGALNAYRLQDGAFLWRYPDR